MKSTDIREKYLSFFEEKGHLRHPSSSLVPEDPTLLTTSAGMVQFKPYFLGLKTPPRTRLTTSQKCLRAKDLDEVGRTPRHHTFFEMLGNFSFGDYFKREAITWAWELLTEVFGIQKEKLKISAYHEDEEAAGIWLDEIGIAKERFYRFGEADHYWPASAPSLGPNGPCGPCSEIFYDFGPDRGCGSPECNPSCDCARHIEIWNLVFMQFERHDGGKLTPLPKKNIDTGSGLERVASVLQGAETNFETDLFMPIIQKLEDMTGVRYADAKVPFRVMADHVRGSGFLIADGVFPSNEGRGYLLRKLIRRAATHGRESGLDRPFLSELIPVVADILGSVYPDIVEKSGFISTILTKEEEQFAESVQQGRLYVINNREKLSSSSGLADGSIVFTAYDTYGLPIEEAEKIARELGLNGIDMAGFNDAMESQKERSRKGSKMDGSVFTEDIEKVYRDAVEGKEAGIFDGYDNIVMNSKVVSIVIDGAASKTAETGQKISLITNRTPFYGEMGGQVGDIGEAVSESGTRLVITESFVVEGKTIVHRAVVAAGSLNEGDELTMKVDAERRAAIVRHHTATHLLHAALRSVLGEHVHQAGSYVGPDKLRFDFTHHAAVSPEELARVEEIVNDRILAALAVRSAVKDIESAKKEGAMALFGEKYGDEVRMIDVEGFSKELCGGTHVGNTAQIGFVKIVEERSIGGSMRRIEALAGKQAIAHINEKLDALKKAAALLKIKDTLVPQTLETLIAEKERLAREIKKAGKSDLKEKSGEALAAAEMIGDVALFAAAPEGLTVDELRAIFDDIKVKNKSFAAVLGSSVEGKANLITAVSQDVADRGLDAGALVKEIAKIVKGGGGGTKLLAQAGGKDGSKIADAVKNGADIIRGKLS